MNTAATLQAKFDNAPIVGLYLKSFLQIIVIPERVRKITVHTVFAMENRKYKTHVMDPEIGVIYHLRYLFLAVIPVSEMSVLIRSGVQAMGGVIFCIKY